MSEGRIAGTVPAVVKNAVATPTDLRVKLPGVFILAVQVTAIGGTPLAEHPVRVIDPATKAPVTDVLTTDKQGRLRARVPENKPYDIEILDPPADLHQPEYALGEHGGRDMFVLWCGFTDGSGQAIGGEKVKVTFHGESSEATTDVNGVIETPVLRGICDLEVRGKTFHAHGVPLDQRGERPVFRFVLA